VTVVDGPLQQFRFFGVLLGQQDVGVQHILGVGVDHFDEHFLQFLDCDAGLSQQAVGNERFLEAANVEVTTRFKQGIFDFFLNQIVALLKMGEVEEEGGA
jgi:hypothetical protein